MSKLHRKISYGNEIFIVDGMWRTGKSLLGPLIGSLEGVQKPKIDYNFEWLCVLNSLGSLSLNDSALMLQMHADLCTHNNYLGREINLRPKDDSGILKNPRPLRNFLNIFRSDKEEVQNEILKSKPSLMIISHSIFQVAEPLLSAYGERLKITLVERNPVYYLSQWSEYLPMVGEDPRELEITKENGNIPWFILDEHELEYKNSSEMDKALIMLRCLIKMKDNIISKNLFDESNLKIIPYESLVYCPEEWMKEVSQFLNKSGQSDALKFQKQLNLPRKYLLDGIKSETLKERRGDLSALEIENYNSLRQIIESKLSKELKDEFIGYVNEYERAFKFPRAMPWNNYK